MPDVAPTEAPPVALLQSEARRLKESYYSHGLRKRMFLIVLVPAVLALVASAVAFGSADIGFFDVYRAILSRVFPGVGEIEASVDIIIWKLRLPRVVMGILTGVALGASGAVMQVVLRNPLADPYMLGISSAAGFGASLAIISGVGLFAGDLLIIGNAFLFSLLSSGLILLLSGRRGANPQTMVLTGLALLFFFQAMTTIIQYFGDSDAVKAAVFWTVGDLGKVNWPKIGVTAVLVVPGTAYLVSQAWNLNILNAGDAGAKSMGVNAQAVRVRTIIVSSLMIAGVVSFTGTIGFIGLVAPHIVRLIIGNDNRYLIPASGLLGALLLVLADTVARTILSPVILPVGAVTAFLGVPLFLYLIMKQRGGAL
jgi:iron complex transport system permease protein